MDIIDCGDIIGARSFIDKNASDNDKKLAANLAISYCKSEPNLIYEVKIASSIIQATKCDKSEAARYFI